VIHLVLFLSIWKTLLFNLKNKYYDNYPFHQGPLPTILVLWAVLTSQASPKHNMVCQDSLDWGSFLSLFCQLSKNHFHC